MTILIILILALGHQSWHPGVSQARSRTNNRPGSILQEPHEGLKMNHSLVPVRMFRITGARVVNSTLVIENVERGEFKGLGCGIDDSFLEEVFGTASVDKYTFCALDALRKH